MRLPHEQRKRSTTVYEYMNMNLFNHNNNSTDNYDIVQLNSCGC